MKLVIFTAALLVCIISTLSTAIPLYEEQLPYETEDTLETVLRERRSPEEKGSFVLQGGHIPGKGNTLRGEYNYNLWQGRSGAKLDANAFYQRNSGNLPGPKHDRGGGVSFSVPLGG
ncbi:uncharacterized protein LOC142321980 [Lycorma delicatula]|uniref:uncharacterized protein LOC142321980 n=1 Tax=Lycorma delicatula TaxID=130591 RepID=UPI003F512B4F